MNEQRFRLRVTFGKLGRLAMLSHLELARALERVVRRAGLPYAVSQGFSPHMRIGFGAALPVGVGGQNEIFDLLLTNYVAPQKALCALAAATVDDLPMFSCEYIESQAPAASVAFPIGKYRVELSRPLQSLKVPDEITVVRKKKEKILNVSDYLVSDVALEGNICTFELQAYQSGSLRVDVFMNACLAETFSKTDEGASNDALARKLCDEVRIVSMMRIAQRA